jgi:heat shock protein HslJ
MKATRKFGILIALMLLVAACDTAYGPEYRADGNPAKLRGKIWQWVGYTTLSGGYFTDVPAHSNFWISGDTISGYDGCNAFYGKCSIDRSLLRADSLGSTRKLCGDQKSFLCQIQESTQYRQRDSLLVLVPESGEMVHLFFKMQ